VSSSRRPRNATSQSSDSDEGWFGSPIRGEAPALIRAHALTDGLTRQTRGSVTSAVSAAVRRHAPRPHVGRSGWFGGLRSETAPAQSPRPPHGGRGLVAFAATPGYFARILARSLNQGPLRPHRALLKTRHLGSHAMGIAVRRSRESGVWQHTGADDVPS